MFAANRVTHLRILRFFGICLLLITLLSRLALAQTDWVVLFQDDFEDGNADSWSFGPLYGDAEFHVEAEGNNYVLSGSGHGHANPIVDGWANYSFKSEVKFIEGSGGVHLNYRQMSNGERYFIGFTPAGIYLNKTKPPGNHINLIYLNEQHYHGRWYVVEIVGVENNIKVYVDGVNKIDYTDNDPVDWGTFGLETLDNSHIHFDDVVVSTDESIEPPWVQTNGPVGGIINTIEIDPDDPNILYAGGAGGGVFKTIDAGTTWTMLEQIVPPSEQIQEILLSPDDPQTIYAHTHRLYKSTNGGVSWQLTEYLGMVGCSAISPGVLLIGRHDGKVYRSTDNGASWTDITSNLPGDRIVDIAIGAGNEYWAGTANGSDGRLYHTTNGGGTWSEMNIGQPAETDIHTIFVDPDDNNIVYVGLIDVHNEMFDHWNDTYLLKTQDGGMSWTRLRLPFTDAMINVMGRAPTDCWLYVGSGGLFKSINGGQTWTDIRPPGQNGDMYDIAVDPTDSDILYLPRRAHGIFKSYNRGGSSGASWDNWTLINDGLNNISISLLAVPSVPGSGTVYATAQSGEGTFKTDDYGNSWNHVNVEGDQITHPWGDEIVVSPHDPETVWYVADVAQVFETTNGGTTWDMIIDTRGGGEGFRFSSVHALASAPSDPDIIYAVKDGFGIFKSEDGGNEWRFLHQSEVDYTYTIAVHPTNPDIVYSGYNPKPFQDWSMVRRTLNGGDSWETVLHVPQSGGITSVVIDPSNPTTVYAASVGYPNYVTDESGVKIYKSTSRGDPGTWSLIAPDMTLMTTMRQNQLRIHPSNPNIVYTTSWGIGTYKTIDGGLTWSKLENAPETSTCLALYEKDPNIIYACDRTKPVIHKSVDGGQTWRQYYTFDASTDAFMSSTVAIHPDDSNTIYAGCFGLPFAVTGPFEKIVNGVKVENMNANLPGMAEGIPTAPIDIELDPANPDTIYVTKHSYGVFKTTDAGQSWVRLDDQGQGSLPRIGYYDIDVDYSDSNTLYALGFCHPIPAYVIEPTGLPQNLVDGACGVYKSTDQGATWNRILETAGSNRAVVVDPQYPNILYVASVSGGVYVSSDAGQSWSQQNDGLPTNPCVSAIVINGDHIYAAVEECGIYAGTVNADYSITWDPSRSNKPKVPVSMVILAVDPSDSNRIHAGAYPGGMIRSDDGGQTWYDRNTTTPGIIVDDPARQGYYTISIDPSDANNVWVGVYGRGVFVSHDFMTVAMFANGDNHEMRGKHITAIVVDPVDPNTVYAASGEGVFVTRDGGKNWSAMNTGLDTRQIQTLAMTADGTLLCGTLGYGLYSYNTLYGRWPMWQQMRAFDNFGTFWPIWDNRPLYQYTSLLFHPTDPNVIYFGTFPAGIYKSTDGGHSWRESNVGWTNDGVFSLIFHPEDPNIIYAGTYNGVNRSTDAAAHWEMWDNGWPPEQWVFSIDFDLRDPNVMYACSKNGENEGTGREGFHGMVMKSNNGGASWFAITNGLDIDQEFYKIIVDLYNPDTLYLATERDGVFISRNAGEVWQPWIEGLTNTVAGTNGNNVTNTMVLSADGCYLYFGTAGSGVFRRQTSYCCVVDFEDLASFTDQWLETNGNPADINGDGQVDFVDFATLANAWIDECPGEWCL